MTVGFGAAANLRGAGEGRRRGPPPPAGSLPPRPVPHRAVAPRPASTLVRTHPSPAAPGLGRREVRGGGVAGPPHPGTHLAEMRHLRGLAPAGHGGGEARWLVGVEPPPPRTPRARPAPAPHAPPRSPASSAPHPRRPPAALASAPAGSRVWSLERRRPAPVGGALHPDGGGTVREAELRGTGGGSGGGGSLGEATCGGGGVRGTTGEGLLSCPPRAARPGRPPRGAATLAVRARGWSQARAPTAPGVCL